MDKTAVANKMDNIGAIFQDAQKYAATQDNISSLISHLETIDKEFQSIAFEGASMELALRSFINKDEMNGWNTYMNACTKHQAQIFLGLGWAVAMDKFIPLEYLNIQYAAMQARVWDGCGYFDGYFRKRQTIQNHARVDYVTENNFQTYDQGLGRRLWYIVEGDDSKITEMVNGFPENRHADLWRGVGMAAAYVGGVGEEVYNKLALCAGEYKIQLSIGAALIAKSSTLADCLTPEVELACTTWCNISAKEAMKQAADAENVDNYSYSKFLSHMKEALKN